MCFNIVCYFTLHGNVTFTVHSEKCSVVATQGADSGRAAASSLHLSETAKAFVCEEFYRSHLSTCFATK